MAIIKYPGLNRSCQGQQLAPAWQTQGCERAANWCVRLRCARQPVRHSPDSVVNGALKLAYAGSPGRDLSGMSLNLAKVTRILVNFVPWSGEARCAREFLSRISGGASRLGPVMPPTGYTLLAYRAWRLYMQEAFYMQLG